METRLLFRCWSPDTDGEYHMYYSSKENCCSWDDIVSRKGAILMQCTGLKDKHGKLIRELDIVESMGKKGTVRFFDNLNYDGGGAVHSGYYCNEWASINDGELNYHYTFEDCEIVNNIFGYNHLINTDNHD